jgi:hypothetical protein
LTTRGHDLPGNLIVGEESLTRFNGWSYGGQDVWSELQALLANQATGSEPSSLGGERPKLTAYRADGSSFLLKFSPPLSTPHGQRWGDLLRVEALCSAVLHMFEVDTVGGVPMERDDRVALTIDRFDRLRRRGRRGATTLYWYAMDRLGDVSVPAPDVVSTLVADGHLSQDAIRTCARVHEFSRAIANTDAHLANYGLVHLEDGRCMLAPIYDVTPMALAPRHDELPDAHLTPLSTPAAADVLPWVEELVAQVESDPEISGEFKDLWRQHIGIGI